MAPRRQSLSPGRQGPRYKADLSPCKGAEETGTDAGFFPTGDRGVAEVFVHGSPPATASPSRDREPLRAAVAVNDSIS